MKYGRTASHLRSLFVVLALGIVGCGPRVPATRVTPPTNSSGSSVEQVCEIVADLMGVERSAVHAETSLDDLGADELDFVELVMELEDHFEIFIPDETLVPAMGTDDWQQGMKSVTMAKLGAIVDGQRELTRPGTDGSS